MSDTRDTSNKPSAADTGGAPTGTPGRAALSRVDRDTGPKVPAREFTVPPGWALGPPPEWASENPPRPPEMRLPRQPGADPADLTRPAGTPDGAQKGPDLGRTAEPRYDSRADAMPAAEAHTTTSGGLPRDTLRDGIDNTLRGLQPAPSAAPPSSRPSPVVVPSLQDPEPVPAEPFHAGEDGESARAVADDGAWDELGRDDSAWDEQANDEARGVGSKAEYSPPRTAPEVTQHKTLETATIKLDPADDPRKQNTARTLRRPGAQSEPAEKPPVPLADAGPSRRPIVVALAVGSAVVVLAIAIGLHSHAERKAEAAASAGHHAVGGATASVPARSTSVVTPTAPRAIPTASVEPRAAGSAAGAPAAASAPASKRSVATAAARQVAPQAPAVVKHKMTALHGTAKPRAAAAVKPAASSSAHRPAAASSASDPFRVPVW